MTTQAQARKWTRYDKAMLVALLIGGALIASMALPIETETWRGPRREVLTAHYNAMVVVLKALHYQQIFGRNPGSLARLNADLPDVQVPATDPWGRPWILSPAFEDPRMPPSSGDLWACSRGRSGTGPCPPSDIPAYQGPLEGSVGYSQQFGSWLGQPALWQTRLARLLDWRLPIAVALLLGSLIVNVGCQVGRALRARSRRTTPTLLKWVLGLAVVAILAAIAIPNLMSSQCIPPERRAASDTKWAVTQAIVYAQEKGVYPTSLKVLRDSGYANVLDNDAWNNPYVLTPVLLKGGPPKAGDDVYVFSRGRSGLGRYFDPQDLQTGEFRAIGYSSVYGNFTTVQGPGERRACR